MVWLSSCNNEKMQKNKKKYLKITGTACLALLKPLTLSWSNGLKPKEAHLDKMEEKNCDVATECCKRERFVYTIALAHSPFIARVLIYYCSCCRDVNVRASSLLG